MTAALVARRWSQDDFPAALSGLMRSRGLTYRQLAHRTGVSCGYLNRVARGGKAAPPDALIGAIAQALRVEPEHFLEYRLRQVRAALGGSPELLDALYATLLLGAPATDVAEALGAETASPDAAPARMSLSA